MEKSYDLSLMDDLDDEIEEIISRLNPAEPRSSRIKKIIDDFNANNQIHDHYFDNIFPKHVANKSFPHWTPCQVAKRVLELFNPSETSQILDVGSGCGKFCLIAGLSNIRGHITGIEQREHLVKIAKEVKHDFNIRNVVFIHGNMSEVDWSDFDCFYLFNPFYEHIMNDNSFWIDQTIDIDRDNFDSYVHFVEAKLKTLKIGTRVVTYHGFGGKFPSEYSLIISEEIHGRFLGSSGFIELWVKTR